MKFRILSDGSKFKCQIKEWFFWYDLGESFVAGIYPFNHYDDSRVRDLFRVMTFQSKYFETLEEAEAYISCWAKANGKSVKRQNKKPKFSPISYIEKE